MIPYSRPHDDPQAPGLRDYRPGGLEPDTRALRGMLWAAVFALIFLLGFATGTVYGAERCLTVRVRPTVMLQRGDIQVEARIARHADHRVYAIAWTSDIGSEGSTQRQLEGADAAALQTLSLRDQPAGHYFFSAAVFGPRGQLLARDRAEIRTLDGADR